MKKKLSLQEKKRRTNQSDYCKGTAYSLGSDGLPDKGGSLLDNDYLMEKVVGLLWKY